MDIGVDKSCVSRGSRNVFKNPSMTTEIPKYFAIILCEKRCDGSKISISHRFLQNIVGFDGRKLTSGRMRMNLVFVRMMGLLPLSHVQLICC